MKTALLVIDAQKIYTGAESEMYCEDAEHTLQNINKLIEHFEGNSDPIVFVRHVHKDDGSDLGRMFDFAGPTEEFNFKEGSTEVEYSEGLRLPPNPIEIVKNRYSAFIGTTLNAMLGQLHVDRVVISGFMTNFCCESSARDAHDLDYFVDFVTDATGTPGTSTLSQSEIRDVVSALLVEGFAEVHSTEDYLTLPS